MTRSRILFLGLAALSFNNPSLALAHDHCDKAEADIKDICGHVSPDQQGYNISIKYKVKIEDARPGEQFDLVMALKQDGCQIIDESGHDVVFVVPLVFPNDCCKDEVVFCDRLQNFIGHCNITCPKDLEIAARVINTQTGKVLDHEKEDIKYTGCVTRHVVVEQPVAVRTVVPAPVVVHQVVQPVVPIRTVRRVIRRQFYYPAPVTRQVSVHVNANW